jgi:hypothetical protein
MTAYVDDETKILLLPIPESKRLKKIKDTVYSFEKVDDLLNRKNEIEESLADDESQDTKRFEDKT